MLHSQNQKHIENWSVINAICLLLATAFGVVYKQLNIVFLVFGLSLVALIVINRNQLFLSGRFFGIANCITLLRFIIIYLSFTFIEYQNTILLCSSLSIAVLLDLLDGKAARHFNESSFFGQYFDMEIDAFYVLLMCMYFYLFREFQAWILLPGLLRYIFRLYTYIFPKPDYKEQKQSYATIIAASYFVILLVGVVTTGIVQYLFLLIGSLAIVISFGIGFIKYQRN